MGPISWNNRDPFSRVGIFHTLGPKELKFDSLPHVFAPLYPPSRRVIGQRRRPRQ